jgi:hypothetical protein
MKTFEDIKAQVRETPLPERLDKSRKMIAAMCKGKRPPAMSIPVQHYDEDVFITTTLEDALAALQPKGE